MTAGIIFLAVLILFFACGQKGGDRLPGAICSGVKYSGFEEGNRIYDAVPDEREQFLPCLLTPFGAIR